MHPIRRGMVGLLSLMGSHPWGKSCGVGVDPLVHRFQGSGLPAEALAKDGARYWDRTSDPLRVREVLYR